MTFLKNNPVFKFKFFELRPLWLFEVCILVISWSKLLEWPLFSKSRTLSLWKSIGKDVFEFELKPLFLVTEPSNSFRSLNSSVEVFLCCDSSFSEESISKIELVAMLLLVLLLVLLLLVLLLLLVILLLLMLLFLLLFVLLFVRCTGRFSKNHENYLKLSQMA